MTDYRKMYGILCKAADEAVTMLESVPGTTAAAERLAAALHAAEEVYIETCEGKEEGS